jgi:hypothetical protein
VAQVRAPHSSASKNINKKTVLTTPVEITLISHQKVPGDVVRSQILRVREVELGYVAQAIEPLLWEQQLCK